METNITEQLTENLTEKKTWIDPLMNQLKEIKESLITVTQVVEMAQELGLLRRIN